MKRRQAQKLNDHRGLVQDYGRHYWRAYKHDEHGYWQYTKMVASKRTSWSNNRWRAYRIAFNHA